MVYEMQILVRKPDRDIYWERASGVLSQAEKAGATGVADVDLLLRDEEAEEVDFFLEIVSPGVSVDSSLN